ncbi:S41 family peptidase [Tunicatimonas pelagia]|uniref:S41 family peptidase n=1 Tax=Tunicatimonas pelagia TaxID=931531 RepID=UPI002665B721|nr:S41 family peptidase [Tunicatimonas pelagia]WKN42194.1 S41 family peptidase [Tunicatimonas pelagia]
MQYLYITCLFIFTVTTSCSQNNTVTTKDYLNEAFDINGKSGIDSIPVTQVSIQPYRLIHDSNPIAVLTGARTASSGEVVVTAFHNKDNIRSFGQSTSGLSTANDNFSLSDGSMIFLTVAVYADRKGIVFGKKIEPDEVIPFSYDEIGLPGNSVIKRAQEWIITM